MGRDPPVENHCAKWYSKLLKDLKFKKLQIVPRPRAIVRAIIQFSQIFNKIHVIGLPFKF